MSAAVNTVVVVDSTDVPLTAEPRLQARSEVPARACKRFPQTNRGIADTQFS